MALNYALVHPEAEVAGAVPPLALFRVGFPAPRLGVLAGELPPSDRYPGSSSTAAEAGASSRATRRSGWRPSGDPLFNHNATPRWFTESNRAQAEVKLRAP